MPDQLPLAFPISQPDLTNFLTKHLALEEEIDRLKAELVVCKEQYQEVLPMRAVLVAVKVTRARRKLEQHAKEPMSLPHQAYLEGLVAEHLDAQEAEMETLTQEAGA